jgi:hypothetical protein
MPSADMKRALVLALGLLAMLLALWWLSTGRPGDTHVESSSAASAAHDATLEVDAPEPAATLPRTKLSTDTSPIFHVRTIDRQTGQAIDGAALSLPVFESDKSSSSPPSLDDAVFLPASGLRHAASQGVRPGADIGRSDSDGIVYCEASAISGRELLIRHPGHCSTIVRMAASPSAPVEVTMAPAGQAVVKRETRRGLRDRECASRWRPRARNLRRRSPRSKGIAIVLGPRSSWTTDGTGEVVMALLPKGRPLYFAAVEHARSRWATGCIAQDARRVDIELIVSDVGAVQGVLLQASGEPAVKSRLGIRSMTMVGEVNATTDEAGRFKLGDVSVGRSWLWFEAASSLSRWVEVETGGTTDLGSLVIPARVEVTGVVTSSTRSCLEDISIYAIQDGIEIDRRTTDASGGFRLSTAPGPQQLIAIQRSVEIGRTSASAPGNVELPISGVDSSIRAKLEPAPVKGKLQAVFVPLEGPHPLSRPWVHVRPATLSELGELRACQSPTGSYAVRAPGRAGQGRLRPECPPRGCGQRPGDSGLRNWSASSLHRRRSPESDPIRVSLDAVTTEAKRALVVSDSGLLVEGLTPGPWILTATVSNGVVPPVPVNVIVGGTVDARLAVRRGALVEGRTTKGGVPAVAEVRLTLRPTGPAQTVESGADGWYHTARVPAGDYALTAKVSYVTLHLSDGDVVHRDST